MMGLPVTGAADMEQHDTANSVRALHCRAVVHAINDGGSEQTVDAQAHAGAARSAVPVHYPFGFAAHTPANGAVTYQVAVGGDAADLVALPPSNPSVARMGNLAEGESALYDSCGQAVYLKNGKIVRVIAHTELLVEIAGSPVLTLTTEKAMLSVPLEVQGKITATDDIVAGSVSVQGHTHSGVTKGSDNTGAPVK